MARPFEFVLRQFESQFVLEERAEPDFVQRRPDLVGIVLKPPFVGST